MPLPAFYNRLSDTEREMLLYLLTNGYTNASIQQKFRESEYPAPSNQQINIFRNLPEFDALKYAYASEVAETDIAADVQQLNKLKGLAENLMSRVNLSLANGSASDVRQLTSTFLDVIGTLNDKKDALRNKAQSSLVNTALTASREAQEEFRQSALNVAREHGLDVDEKKGVITLPDGTEIAIDFAEEMLTIAGDSFISP